MELFIDSQLGYTHLEEYKALLEESDQEGFFYGVPLNRRAERTVIIVGEAVVGFFEHGKVDFDGKAYYRTNRPYTGRQFRGEGLMTEALAMWYLERKPAMCWIDDDNVASIRLFKNVGFHIKEAFQHKNKAGHFYLLA